MDLQEAGRAGWWRGTEPAVKSTQGCGWLPPVAQYQGEEGEDIHYFLSKRPPVASITIDCEKLAAPLKGDAGTPRAAAASVFPDPSWGPPPRMQGSDGPTLLHRLI